MATEEEKKEAMKKMAEHVQAAYDELEKAKRIAEEHGLSFTFEPSYGMGGTYHGEAGDYYESGWISSSEQC